MRQGPLVLVVMDGVGDGPADAGNAVALARTPTLDTLRAIGLYTQLKAHGRAVGLPSDDDMGNSEVGHNALGAGRIFDQGATLVDRAITSGQLFNGAAWQHVLGDRTGTLHLIGLLSDGNVHSHERHLVALLRAARAAGIERAQVHALLDGRDVPDGSALEYVDRLEAVLRELGPGFRIASGGGRMRVTMDRYEADWRIVERGWKAHVHGAARRFPSARAAIEAARAESPGCSDQHLPPFVVDPATPMADGDGVVLFNFRGDRAIELTRAFETPPDGRFEPFDRGRVPRLRFAGMTQYDGDLRLPASFLVTPPVIDRPLTELLVEAGIAQWAGSETQKFGHVTYFWNGNRSEPIDPRLETWVEVPSDRVPFDERPWMKSAELTDAVLEAVRAGRHPFVRLNYANGDMVGHTGNLDSTVLAVETVDLALDRLRRAVAAVDGRLIVTADHGNADQMFLRDKAGGFLRDPATGAPRACTSHSLSPVPFIVWPPPPGLALRDGGGLANVAATVLALLGLDAPSHYEPSLLTSTTVRA